MDQPIDPTFVGIGPGKCGTTWLYEALSNHPQVCVSTAKETLFFSDAFDRGVDWYRRFFNPQDASKSAIGEVSNTYIFDPRAAARMANLFPKLKIIANLRDPIERAFSHYLFMLRNSEITGSFEEAIEKRPDLLSRGLYAKHLTPYFECFSESQRLVLFYDDLKDDPKAYAERVFRFIDVQPSLYQGDAAKKVLGASRARNRWVAKMIVGAAAVTRRLGRPDLVSRVKQSAINHMIFRPYDPGEKPVLLPETRERLIPFFQDDLNQLASMTARDVRALWKLQMNPDER